MSLYSLPSSDLVEFLIEELLKDFDPTIDGDITNTDDLKEFLEPFLNTIALKSQAT